MQAHVFLVREPPEDHHGHSGGPPDTQLCDRVCGAVQEQDLGTSINLLEGAIAGATAGGEEPTRLNLEKWVSIAVYYLIMLFVHLCF